MIHIRGLRASDLKETSHDLLEAEKIETLPGLHACFTCADNLGCNLEPRCESMSGCIKWRCRVCRAPWWTVGYDHEACNTTGVHNGVTYHDGTHMAPLPDASGHYYRHGGYCRVHQIWRCGIENLMETSTFATFRGSCAPNLVSFPLRFPRGWGGRRYKALAPGGRC